MEVNDLSSRILASLLEGRTGQQLAMSRRWRIETSLKVMMREKRIESVDQLIASIVSARDPSLADAVVDALLNNETFFFRDRAAFDLLLKGALDRVEQARANERTLSIWCAGCSTGQEPYSIAMAIAEQPQRWAGWRIQIVASDVSRSAIARARAGIYSQFEVQRGLPVVQMIRWFDEIGQQQWRISEKLRDMVRFQTHNLMESGPASRPFDIILCRNVLLYFTPQKRREVFQRLASASAPDAFLMLGAGETTIGQTEAFASDPELRGIYRRIPEAAGDARRLMRA